MCTEKAVKCKSTGWTLPAGRVYESGRLACKADGDGMDEDSSEPDLYATKEDEADEDGLPQLSDEERAQAG
eukprot:8564627-Alexandrium_andersonii.AAC.1